MSKSGWNRLKSGIKNAFAVEDESSDNDLKEEALNEEELAIIDKLARKIVSKSLTIPTVMFLESVKPLNVLGANVLAFFQPYVQSFLNWKQYETFQQMLERRGTIEFLVRRIEKFEAEEQAKKKESKTLNSQKSSIPAEE